MDNTRTLTFEDNNLAAELFGPHNIHVSAIENQLGISIKDRGNELTLHGSTSKLAQAETILNRLWSKLQNGQEVGMPEVEAEFRFTQNGHETPLSRTPGSSDQPEIVTWKKKITGRSPMQNSYLESIAGKEMVFGVGPAGTGKTYLAVAAAVQAYKNGEVQRLIFSRPALEAGERLGFLPGDMKEKIDPYLRPIYDALHDFMHFDKMEKKIETGEIEIAPLAFMRGRTLSNAFIVLDEAQNATPQQMKMFLTRMGGGSKMVITGDPGQSDLPAGVTSGLNDAIDTLSPIKDIAFVRFTREDVIRHKLVGKIISAYDKKNPQRKHSNKHEAKP